MKKIFTILMMLLVTMVFTSISFALDDGMGLKDRFIMSSSKSIPAVVALKGHYRIELHGSDGRLKDVREGDNTVVNNGKYGVMDQILDTPSLNKMTYMAVGTGAMTCSGSTNALVTQLEDRHSFTSKTRGSAVITVVGDWAAGHATGALAEAGTFDASTSGYMWMCASFSTINKGANDTLTITWTLTGS